jgi:hypothetical protein
MLTIKLMHSRLLFALIISLMSGILFSCSAERNLARTYVKAHKGDGILISPLNFLYKENLGAFIDKSKFPSINQQDSVAFYSSNYVQYISDSIFLTNFTNSLIDELGSYGYNVTLDESADVFLGSGNSKWIVQLSQLQLDEDFIPRRVFGYDYDDEEYYQDYRQNLISLSSWIEVNPLNSVNGKKQLLYLDGYIIDDASQNISLDYYNGEFYLKDFRDTISFLNIYEMATASGKKHAELLFDYFMNDYIRSMLPKSIANRKEMHYDHKLKHIEAGLIERFDVIR